MGNTKKNLDNHSNLNIPDAAEMAFGVVISEWNHDICEAMKSACIQTLQNHGVKESNIHIAYVPGSFELPVGARLMLNSHKLEAVICIGCVIKGETKHDEYINNAVATGLVQLGLMSSKPCIFCVLTTDNEEQARERAGGKHGNKGTEAAISALKMAGLKAAMTKTEKKIGY